MVHPQDWMGGNSGRDGRGSCPAQRAAMASSWSSEAEATDDAPRAVRSPQERYDAAMSAAFVLITVVALLCVALLAVGAPGRGPPYPKGGA